ncbi:MAG TPA: hypothetical protein VFA21_04280 [Pyrinomonadaceae bacterium]|jgi:hypothetical protein|nr:hypothetical protein [Pyrinomonadaceae bacterium]
MNVASVILFLIGLFGLFLLIMGLLSVGQAGNVPFFGRMFGGWFLVIVSLFLTVCGFVGFFRMRRR